jgi:hypothetical protein
LQLFVQPRLRVAARRQLGDGAEHQRPLHASKLAVFKKHIFSPAANPYLAAPANLQ